MMVAAVIFAFALASGLPLRVVAFATAVAIAPVLLVPAAVMIAVLAWRRRRAVVPTAADEAAFLRAVASGLAAGASLRMALAEGARRCDRLDLERVTRLARAGMPAQLIAEALSTALPVTGRLVGPAVELAAHSGGSTGNLFHSLAVSASEQLRLDREARSGTAAARASAVVVAGLPVVAVVGLGVTGRLELGADSAVGLTVVAGFGLQALGVGVMWLMMRGTVVRRRAAGPA